MHALNVLVSYIQLDLHSFSLLRKSYSSGFVSNIEKHVSAIEKCDC